MVISYKRPDVFWLYPLGDIHAGTIHCAEQEIKNKVKEIAETPNAYWVGLGDYCEFITPKDKRWEPSQQCIPDWLHQDNIAEDQQNYIINLFEPIKDKCLGLMYGNHENSIRLQNHANVHKNICDKLGVSNLGYSCFLNLRFRRCGHTSKDHHGVGHLVKCCFTHGTGGARTEGGKINYLKEFMGSFEASIYGYAHVHAIQIFSPQALAVNEGLKITAKGKVGALTGCWFRTYTQGEIASYGEMKVYKPSRIGCPRFYIVPDKGELGVEVPAVMP